VEVVLHSRIVTVVTDSEVTISPIEIEIEEVVDSREEEEEEECNNNSQTDSEMKTPEMNT
jgi:hypothetical protein